MHFKKTYTFSRFYPTHKNAAFVHTCTCDVIALGGEILKHVVEMPIKEN